MSQLPFATCRGASLSHKGCFGARSGGTQARRAAEVRESRRAPDSQAPARPGAPVVATVLSRDTWLQPRAPGAAAGRHSAPAPPELVEVSVVSHGPFF